MFKAVVFDMDGVLIDTEKVYRRCWKENGMSIGIPEPTMDIICDRVAGGNKQSNSLVFKEYMGEDFEYLKFRARTMEMFEEYINRDGVELKSNVVETLKLLKEKGYKIALATSTDVARSDRRLKEVGLYDFFDEQVHGDEIDHGKPAPDIYMKACEKLGFPPEQVIGVEDSINGVISAKGAGLFTVMVVDLIKPNDKIKETADRIYYNMKDMWELLQNR